MNGKEISVRRAMDVAMYLEISAPLRAIFVSYGEANIHFDSYFDGEVSDEDRESMSCIETELIAMDDERRNSYSVHRKDYPEPLPKGDLCVYARREATGGLKGDVSALLKRLAVAIKAKNDREIQRDETVRIAVQEALIGRVSARLRKLRGDFGHTNIHLDSYFDGEVSDQDRKSMASVDADLRAAFPKNHRITSRVHRVDYPEPIPKYGWCFFARREYFVEPHFTTKGEQGRQRP